VTARPFVKSARLLSAKGHPADAVIEMWRPNTDAWALRGHLDSVAAKVSPPAVGQRSSTASRLADERLDVHRHEVGLARLPTDPLVALLELVLRVGI
jgi:hypothetical protein